MLRVLYLIRKMHVQYPQDTYTCLMSEENRYWEMSRFNSRLRVIAADYYREEDREHLEALLRSVQVCMRLQSPTARQSVASGL